MKRLTTIFMFFTFLAIATPLLAVEVAPRISDREIIESLAQLKAEHKIINQRFDSMNHSINQRFDSMNHSINQRFDSINHSINQRFNSVNRRIDDLRSDINIRLNVMIGVLTIVLGFILRMQWQMNRRLVHVETSLETQKDEIVWLKEMINKLLPPKGVL